MTGGGWNNLTPPIRNRLPKFWDFLKSGTGPLTIFLPGKIWPLPTIPSVRPWVEWSRGRPITEKGVAELLHEYRIISKPVGPKDNRAKGYRKADFGDAWKRYLPPEADEKAEGPDSAVLPFTRTSPCNDYEKDEKSAVHQDGGEREKIDPFSSEINAVYGCTGKMVNPEPLLSSPSRSADDGDGLGSLRRCLHCKRPGLSAGRWTAAWSICTSAASRCGPRSRSGRPLREFPKSQFQTRRHGSMMTKDQLIQKAIHAATGRDP